MGRPAAQLIAWPEQRDPFWPVGICQTPRSHDAAAVAAGAAQHQHGRGVQRCWMACATGRPAFSISALPLMPEATVNRSACAISAALSRATLQSCMAQARALAFVFGKSAARATASPAVKS